MSSRTRLLASRRQVGAQAAVSVGGPTMRLSNRLPAIEQAVRGGAEEISRILGFVGDWPAGDPGGAAG
ncbi:MAG: hypothetical protein KDH93_02785 [Rhodoferax sp.]|nr:hypothetical protein [Rhodoferax sp.]